MTVYFDEKSEISEAVHGEVRIDERFIERLVELGVEFAEDLGAFQEFLKKIVQAYDLGYNIPDIKAMRDELREALEGRKAFGRGKEKK
jgi:Zn-dependent M32 family carboxypeptidase